MFDEGFVDWTRQYQILKIPQHERIAHRKTHVVDELSLQEANWLESEQVVKQESVGVF